jgi:hypothetical protein
MKIMILDPFSVTLFFLLKSKSPLFQVFSYAFKNLKRQQIVKTVVEGGATVQVTSQDGSNSDEEEDEENVFNIKVL